jgi:4-amino-4-deoxy-L-arabinose transferase-like glycosyltransferase
MAGVSELSRHRVAWACFLGVTVLALVLNCWNLTDAGYGNTYYAAAIRSMSLSSHNFFFGAFDQEGFISIDKPPVFLWVPAASARIFGYSSLSILLPSTIAGTASVSLLWVIVRRSFGVAAATIAGLVLALSPIAIATNQLEMPEPFLILCLVGAAGCVMQSIESGRWYWWMAGAGLLVGAAFNMKMLGAWMPVPAFALAIIAAQRSLKREELRRVAASLAVFGVVSLVVAGSWIAIVDAWPASDRPYVGGSTNNDAIDLLWDYNGFGRILGTGQAAVYNPDPGYYSAGGVIGGSPGPLRLFDEANGGQIGWVLPFAIAGGLLALWHWREDRLKRALTTLFVGWMLLFGVTFSFAEGTVHAYYTASMGPGIAALVGIGGVALASEIGRDRRWLAAAFSIVAVNVVVQLVIAGRVSDFYGWVRPLTVIGALAGLALLTWLAVNRQPVVAGMAIVVGALLVLPAAWSVSESANTSLNNTLPQAGPRGGWSGGTFGSEQFDVGQDELAAWLRTQDIEGLRWQLVLNSAQNGARLVAEHDIRVMSLGGFSGHDVTIGTEEFASLVEAGEVRYVETSTSVGENGPTELTESAKLACQRVDDPGIPAGFTIWDCAGRADALR